MKHASDRLAAHLAGELPADERAAVDDHLRRCPACAGELEAQRRAWEALAEARIEAGRSPGLWEAVRARTFGEPAWFFGARPWVRRGWAAAAVAAGLVTGALLPAMVTPGEAGADPADPVLAGSMWNDEETGDLAAWWLAGAEDGKDR